MTEEVTEDVMHKREAIMEDGKRKLYYFTFGTETAEAEADDKQVGDSKETKTNE